ncbi:MAG: 4-hydroxythreonine-4-phosphate dehydrogenase PdxA [Bdellovibrio sp.]|nr:4-hydroxythreonine-4-phosphate dehydrogenase PdxA [Bdellovibrio sp.]
MVIHNDDLARELEMLCIPYKLTSGRLELHNGNIPILSPRFFEHSETLNSLLTALPLIQENDILFTLPSSKDQFYFQNTHHRGYTDFFRDYFHISDISMTFKGPNFDLLLLTDHIPLSEVVNQINADIFHKIEISLLGSRKYFTSYDEVVILGLNPHAGEGGRIGTEEMSFEAFLRPLRDKFSTISFKGPFAADSVFLSGLKYKKKTLLVSPYHDQILPLFKALAMFHSAQITFGLPFLRMSVVHGTGEDIYGKNSADPSSLLYGLDTIFTSKYGLHLNRAGA